ncbi:MAG: hypothetical protein L6Q57_06810 [Alphaproteobacteria bacterium]|nr:hypothetical protein [Alphaproteobacteria bacterium]
MKEQPPLIPGHTRSAWIAHAREVGEGNDYKKIEQVFDVGLNPAIRLDNKDPENDKDLDYDAALYVLWVRSCFQQGKYKKAYEIARWAVDRFSGAGSTKGFLEKVKAKSHEYLVTGTWSAEHFPHWGALTSDDTPLAYLVDTIESLMGRGQYHDALACLQKAEALAPDFFYLPYCEAVMEEKIGSKEKAKDLLRKSLALYPGNIMVLQALIPLLLEKRQTLAEGEKLLIEALDIDPSNLLLNLCHAEMLSMLGYHQTAYEILRTYQPLASQGEAKYQQRYAKTLAMVAEILQDRGKHPGLPGFDPN